MPTSTSFQTLCKLGLALLGVATLGRLIRSIEGPGQDSESASASSAAHTSSQDRPRSQRAPSSLPPVALAALVLTQVAGILDRPLAGDELINYDWHLKLPFTGVLTSMEAPTTSSGSRSWPGPAFASLATRRSASDFPPSWPR